MSNFYIEQCRVIAKYPQSIRARANNINIGDVICTHVDVPCIYITEQIYESLTKNPDLLEGFWIVART